MVNLKNPHDAPLIVVATAKLQRQRRHKPPEPRRATLRLQHQIVCGTDAHDASKRHRGGQVDKVSQSGNGGGGFVVTRGPA